MYSFSDILKLLEKKFNAVPNVSQEDVEAWLEESFAEHGVTRTTQVPPQFATLILLYAEALGTGQVAVATAHYFSFTDKDEEVDKSMVSEGYLKVSKLLWDRYDLKSRQKIDGFRGSNVRYMRRLDRDDANG